MSQISTSRFQTDPVAVCLPVRLSAIVGDVDLAAVWRKAALAGKVGRSARRSHVSTDR